MVVFIQILGVFCGVLARTSLPFFRKLYRGKVKKFDRRYAFQAAGAFFISIVISFLIFPQYPFQKEPVEFLDIFKLFCLSFGFGFGFNSLLNETSEWLGGFHK